MKSALRIVVAALAVAAAACGGGGQTFGPKDQASIRSKGDALVEAFNAKQIPQLVDLYAENIVFMPPNRPIVRGKDPLKGFFQELTANTSGLKLTVDEVSGSGPLAYAAGAYEMEVANAKGAPTRDRGNYLFVLRQLGGTWRYEYSIWNSDLPTEPSE